MTTITDNGFARITKETLVRNTANPGALTGNDIPYNSLLTINEKISTITGDDLTADLVINVPSGNLVATNVQDALNELQSELDTIATALGSDDNYVTDAEKVVIGNTSGTNSGDNSVNALYSGLVSNATHTGDVTGATALTIANDVVTNAKMANMATKTYKGRTTAGTGDPEDVAVATLKTDLVLVKGDVGLGNVDNTSDATKNSATATLTNKTLTTPKFVDNGFIADSNGNELLSFNLNASAVNYLEIENGTTTNPPHLRAMGDDTNIGLHLVGKGTGEVSVCDATDETKRLRFGVSNNGTGIVTTLRSNSTGTSKVIDLPNATDTLVGRTTTDTLSGKSIALGSNTVTGTMSEFSNAVTDGDILYVGATQTFTNKTATGATNILTARLLKSATTEVDVSSATAPTTGQVLTATSSTAATWQTPSSGGSDVGCTAITPLITTLTASNTWENIQLSGELFDSGGNFNTSTHRFTAPTTGMYFVSASIRFTNAVDQIVNKVAIYKNGSAEHISYNTFSSANHNSHGPSVAMYLTAGDYLELWAYHQGTTRTISNSQDGTYLSVIKVN